MIKASLSRVSSRVLVSPRACFVEIRRNSSGHIKFLPGGVLPYMGYIGMCGPKGYGFSAVLVIDRVSILANFGHFGHKWGMVFALQPYMEEEVTFHHYRKENQ